MANSPTDKSDCFVFIEYRSRKSIFISVFSFLAFLGFVSPLIKVEFYNSIVMLSIVINFNLPVEVQPTITKHFLKYIGPILHNTILFRTQFDALRLEQILLVYMHFNAT